MARTSLLEDLFTMLVTLPWWVGVTAAGLFFALGRFYAPGDPGNFMRPAISVIFNAVAILSLAAAAVSAIKNLLRPRSNGGKPDTSANPTTSSGISPACPLCGYPMALRTAKRGAYAGSSFYGCTRYPGCKGTRPAD